jgi:hypothetical protein
MFRQDNNIREVIFEMLINIGGSGGRGGGGCKYLRSNGEYPETCFKSLGDQGRRPEGNGIGPIIQLYTKYQLGLWFKN